MKTNVSASNSVVTTDEQREEVAREFIKRMGKRRRGKRGKGRKVRREEDNGNVRPTNVSFL